MAIQLNFLDVLPEIQILIIQEHILDSLTSSFDPPALLDAVRLPTISAATAPSPSPSSLSLPLPSISSVPTPINTTAINRRIHVSHEAHRIWTHLLHQALHAPTITYTTLPLYIAASASSLQLIHRPTIYGLLPLELDFYIRMPRLRSITLDYTNIQTAGHRAAGFFRAQAIGRFAAEAARVVRRMQGVEMLVLRDKVASREEEGRREDGEGVDWRNYRTGMAQRVFAAMEERKGGKKGKGRMELRYTCKEEIHEWIWVRKGEERKRVDGVL